METIKVKLMWFKESGKYYSSGTATVPLNTNIKTIKQAIVDTQDGLIDEWVDDDFYLMVDTYEDAPVGCFCTYLFLPTSFRGMKKKSATLAQAIEKLEKLISSTSISPTIWAELISTKHTLIELQEQEKANV